MAWTTEKALSPTATARQAGVVSSPQADRQTTDIANPSDAREPGRPRLTEYQPSRMAMTGATGALGRRFLERVLKDLPQTHITTLVRTASPSFRCPEMQQLVEQNASRLTIVDADLRHGVLSPNERKLVTETDGGLWHFAASTNLRPADEEGNRSVREINDGGTARLLDMLKGSDRPGPLFHLSTAYVCGDRSGVIREEDLTTGQGFRNSYEESKHSAETRVLSHREAGLDCVVFRPSLVTNESAGDTTGHILDVLASFFSFAARSGRCLTLPMPATASINAVEVDWLVRALLALAPYSKSSRTYHLTARKETCVSTVADTFTRLFGAFALKFANSVEGLSNGAKRLAKMLAPFSPYFDARVRFDRTNLETDAPHLAHERELDLDTALLLWQKSVA